MDNLPQRDDLIYKEIEEFQDYELTECIVYEMAMRTFLVKEYLKLRKSIGNKILEFYKLEEEILNECWLHYKDIYLEHNEKYNIIDEMPSHINNKTSFSMVTDLDYNEISVIDNNQLSRQAYKTTSRPLLSIPKEFKNDVIVQINFNLPKKEIIAYIEKMKDFNDNKFFIGKSPSTIIEGIIMKYTNEPIFKTFSLQKKLADMFFIYDYFIFQDKKYENEREKLKNELEIKIKEINKKWNYDKSDKKDEIEEQRKDYKTNKQKYSKEQIIDELMKELKFNRTKVNDYLKIMRMFIDDLEYKKLLTGDSKLY